MTFFLQPTDLYISLRLNSLYSIAVLPLTSIDSGVAKFTRGVPNSLIHHTHEELTDA